MLLKCRPSEAAFDGSAAARKSIYMTNKLMSLLTGIAVLGGGAMLLAQQGANQTKTGERTLMVSGKNYPLTHALAYETKVNGEEVIAVVLSGQAVSSEKLKEAREAEKEGNDSDFKRPYIKLVFTKTGALKYWSAGAGNTQLGRRAGNATGELKLQDGRVMGKASQPNETEGMFPTGLDVHFDVALLRAGESLPATVVKKPGPAANVKPSVTGVFKGNGKEAKLAHVSAHWREPFSDKPSMVLVFTEKDHSKDKKPDFNAGFGKFGSALVVSLHEDGDIFGCEVAHSALKHQNFSSIGKIRTNNFEFADGQVQGELATDGPVDVFGETWEVKIKFVAPLGEIPKEYQIAESTETKQASPKSEESKPVEADNRTATKPAAPGLNAKDLALTKDATDVEYKSLVEQMSFKSKLSVKSACADLSANLKAQGWAKDGDDLITPNSSILNRKRGSAKLTIFVKPEAGGSEVKMMTEGLSWDGQ